MAIIALSATIVSAVFIYFGLVVGATRRYFEALMSGRIKWVVAAYSFVCLLLSIASWAIFISFPSALSDADYCPDSFLGTSPLPPQNKYLEYTHLFQLDPFGSPAFFRAMGKSSVMVRDLCRIGDLWHQPLIQQDIYHDSMVPCPRMVLCCALFLPRLRFVRSCLASPAPWNLWPPYRCILSRSKP